MTGLVLGATGQVGRCLGRLLEDACFLTSAELDLSVPEQIRESIVRRAPDFIVNAAAYTAVDQAETHTELAVTVNGHAVGEIAAAAAELDVPLIHFSTDYVFSGREPTPYRESDVPEPVNAYGRSKLLGEQLIEAAGLNAYWILRCSWVFSEFGTNFVRTMLRLSRAGTNPLRVVSDQKGRPTYAGDIASAVARLLERWSAGHPAPSGIYHCTSNGACSWYQFASDIVQQAHQAGLISEQPTVEAIATSDYPTPARRPSNSVLVTEKLERELDWRLPHWQEGLRQTLTALARA